MFHIHYLISIYPFFRWQKLLEENIRKVKLSTPDYRDMDPEEADDLIELLKIPFIGYRPSLNYKQEEKL